MLLLLFHWWLTLQQTKVTSAQLKDVTLSPIAAVEKWNCVGSGPYPDGKPGTWDCGGLQMIRLILTDGKVLGPYLLIKGQDISLDAKWTRIPLATSGPGDTP